MFSPLLRLLWRNYVRHGGVSGNFCVISVTCPLFAQNGTEHLEPCSDISSWWALIVFSLTRRQKKVSALYSASKPIDFGVLLRSKDERCILQLFAAEGRQSYTSSPLSTIASAGSHYYNAPFALKAHLFLRSRQRLRLHRRCSTY